jgi:hypothetical protein
MSSNIVSLKLESRCFLRFLIRLDSVVRTPGLIETRYIRPPVYSLTCSMDLDRYTTSTDIP